MKFGQFLGTVALLGFSTPLAAQNMADWQVSEQPGGMVVAKHKSGNAAVMVGGKAGTPAQLESHMRDLAANLNMCGITTTTPLSASKYTGAREMNGTGALMRCRVVGAHRGGQSIVVFGMEPVKGPEDADPIIDLLAAKTFGGTGTAAVSRNLPQPSPQPSPKPMPAPSPVGGDAALVAAITAIPVANRPIGMAYRSEWNSVAMSMGYTPYMLFGGGIAAEADCPNWNPKGARPGAGCDTTSWRRVGADKIHFGDDDDPTKTGGFNGYKPGQRIAANMSRQGGGGVSGASNVHSGTLRLTSSGQIDVGSYNGVSVGGGNYSGYSGNSGSVRGSYYLNGYIIAIRDQQGRVSVAFFGGKRESGGNYLFLNGEMFWE